jgi:hypothetical protein
MQHRMARDPGPGAAALSCGPPGHDGRRGTGFARPGPAALQAGDRVEADTPPGLVGLPGNSGAPRP